MNFALVLKYLKNPYFLCVLVLTSWFMHNKTQRFVHERKVAKLEKQIVTLTQSIDTCESINKDTVDDLTNLQLEYYEIVSYLDVSKDKNEKAVETITELKTNYEKRIKQIEQSKPVTQCDSVAVDDDFAQWMRQK